MNQQSGPIISAGAAAIAAFVIILLTGSDFAEALIYAVIAAAVAYLITMFMRNRRRGV
jgi:ABC-type Fe3+-siderophore transport system permease subunit